MPFTPKDWEWMALAAAAAGWALGRWAWPRVAARVAHRVPERLRAAWAHPATDWLLAALCVLAAGWPAWAVWSRLTPARAPMGPDYENFVGSALAFETGRWDLYFNDRYPGYPWLVSVVAPDALSLPRAGTTLSMALTALAAAPLYWIGRLVSGRAAGVVGALLGLRLAVSLDVGHSFTHYPLTATLDLAMVALACGLALTRSRAVAVACVGGLVAAATLAIASDPKQIPLALGLCGLAALSAAARGPGRWLRLPLALATFAPLPLAHALVGRYHLGLLSLEALTIRTPLTFTDREALKAVQEQGFALGDPGAMQLLLPSFRRVAENVQPKVHGAPDPGFVEALGQIFPMTSMLWVGLLLALVPLWLARGRGPRAGRALAAVALLGFAASGLSPARLHYAHRYGLPYAQAAPVGAASAVGLALGGWGVAGLGAVALSVGPYAAVDRSFLQREADQGDIWIGYEKAMDVDTLEWVAEHLPADSTIFDFGERQAMTVLAAAFPYVRCADDARVCSGVMPETPGTLVALVRANDFISSELPGGPRERLRADRYGRLPDTLGDCWQRRYMPGPNIGFYVWTCASPPEGWPSPAPRPATHR
ncbi:MAG: hypothetical protein H6739_38545 [Alphaproteobacteria bacterium]|nr:hypothetical protein [Alphaproteobacteria bacterium]